MKRQLFITLILFTLLLGRWQPAAAVTDGDQRTAVAHAVNWLVATHQNDDGGYSSFSAGANAAPSDVGGTVDAIISISSAGYNAAATVPGKDSNPIAYLRQNSADVVAYASADGGSAGKLVMALAAASQDPRRFEGEDFVAILQSHLADNGQFGVTDAFNQSLALLALAAAGESVPETATTYLLSLQADDGSWDDGFGTLSNPDATAMVIMALLASGLPADDAALIAAADFLASAQLPTGGWEYGPGFGQNGNSTGLVVQALAALGLDFYSTSSPFLQETETPFTTLISFQGESGAFQADFGDGPFDDFFTTVQMIPAAVGKAYPLPGRFLAAQRAVACLPTLRDADTGGWEQFASFGVDAAGTSRAVQAIAAVGQDPNGEAWTADGITPLQALAELTPAYLVFSRGGGIGIVMQGVVAAGGDVHDFAGLDLELQLSQVLSPTGEYDATNFGPFAHTEAMLGLLVSGGEVDETAVAYLLNSHTDGDWGGPDSNGLALNVLGRLGQSVPEVLLVLHNTQEADGGWGFGSASPNSTSEVVQGLTQIGENPFGPDWSKVVSGTLASPADVIMAQQGANGCWPNLFGEGDDPFSTTDAIIMLAQQPGWPELVQPVLISAEPTAEPTAVPTQEPVEEPTALPTSKPSPTPLPTVGPTLAPTLTPGPRLTATPTVPTPTQPAEPNFGSTGIIIAVIAVLGLGGAAVFLRNRR
jgi:hypothetical protein